MNDAPQFTDWAIRRITLKLAAFVARKDFEKLAGERAVAAFGENAQADVKLINPIAVGENK